MSPDNTTITSDVPSPAAADRRERALSGPLLTALGLLAAFAPVAMDLYLPAFPQMVTGLHTSSSLVQLTMTAFLAGGCIGQFLFGPLSDRLGRRGPLLAGCVIAVVASVAAAAAPSIGLLIVARAVQGFMGAAGMVIGRAVIADRARGAEAARGFTLVMLVNGVVPVIAPFLGSLLLAAGSWRVPMWFIVVVSLVTLALTAWLVPESLPAARRAEIRAERAASPDAGPRFGSRRFVAHAVCFVFSFSTLMAYISGSSFLYQSVLGFGSLQYGLLFGLNAMVLTCCSTCSARLVRHYGPGRLLSIGLCLTIIGVAGVLAIVLTGAPARWILVPLAIAVGSCGFNLGNSTSLAMSAVPGASGRASALLGGFQFGMAAVVSSALSVLEGRGALPVAGIMVVTGVIAALARLVGATVPFDDPAGAGTSRA